MVFIQGSGVQGLGRTQKAQSTEGTPEARRVHQKKHPRYTQTLNVALSLRRRLHSSFFFFFFCFFFLCLCQRARASGSSSSCAFASGHHFFHEKHTPRKVFYSNASKSRTAHMHCEEKKNQIRTQTQKHCSWSFSFSGGQWPDCRWPFLWPRNWLALAFSWPKT